MAWAGRSFLVHSFGARMKPIASAPGLSVTIDIASGLVPGGRRSVMTAAFPAAWPLYDSDKSCDLTRVTVQSPRGNGTILL